MFKKSFTELFYLALLLTALRPPQNRYYNPHERLYRFTPTDPLGPITAEYLNEDCFNDYFYSSKNSFLLNTRYDLLEDINSLGRYSRPLLNSNVLAFPVSHVNSDDQDNNNNPLSLLENYDSHLPQLPLDIFEVRNLSFLSNEICNFLTERSVELRRLLSLAYVNHLISFFLVPSSPIAAMMNWKKKLDVKVSC